MNRRLFTRFLCGSMSVLYAGCSGQLKGNGEISPRLDIFAVVERTDSGWKLTVRARNTLDWDVSLHDVTILAFSDTGEEVCQAYVGDLIKLEEPDRTVTANCSAFPAIITGDAEESPCDGAKIEIIYWIGSDEQRHSDVPNDVKLWEDTYRKCNEPVPPDRVLEQVHTTQEESRGPLLNST